MSSADNSSFVAASSTSPSLPERYALADKIDEIHEEWEKRPHPRTSFGDYVSPRILEWIREGQNR